MTKLETMMKKINTGKEFKAIVNSWMRRNGYKKYYTMVKTSYINGFAHLTLKNKYKNDNPEYMDLLAYIVPEGEQRFGEVMLTVHPLTREGKHSWRSINDVTEEYYTL